MDAILSAGQYKIGPDMIVLDTNYMYVDVPVGRTMLICLPVIRKKAREGIDFCAFFRQIIFTAQFDQTEDCDYVATIVSCLNSTAAFSLMQFKGLLTEIGAGAGTPPAQPDSPVFPVGGQQVQTPGTVSDFGATVPLDQG